MQKRLTRNDLSSQKLNELGSTRAWNFTVASNNQRRLAQVIAIAARCVMVPAKRTAPTEILGSDPRKLSGQFTYSVRFETKTGQHPTRLQAFEFAGQVSDKFPKSTIIKGAEGVTGANYFFNLDGKKLNFDN